MIKPAIVVPISSVVCLTTILLLTGVLFAATTARGQSVAAQLDPGNVVLTQLSNTVGLERYRILYNLNATNRIASGLTVADLNAIIAGMEDQRAQVIRLMARKLQQNLSAADVVALSGQTTGSTRYAILYNLNAANRIASGLTVTDLNAIIAGMEDQRAQVIRLMARKLQPNLSAADVVASGGSARAVPSIGANSQASDQSATSAQPSSGAAAPAQATEAAPRITLVTGHSDAVGVELGRWNGQPAYAPATASNRYKGFLASDSYTYGSAAANPYYWDIHGSNFGEQEGAIQVGPAPSPFGSVIVVRWTPTKIRVKAVASRSYRASTITLRVVTYGGQISPLYRDNAVGLIKSRGFGQCTWEVAYQRLAAGLSIPARAYPAGTAIDHDYVPQRYDVLFWGDKHTAIITSEPVHVVAADGLKTWSFMVTERNARWNEEATTRMSSFKVTGSQIVEGVLSEATKLGTATSYWR